MNHYELIPQVIEYRHNHIVQNVLTLLQYEESIMWKSSISFTDDIEDFLSDDRGTDLTRSLLSYVILSLSKPNREWRIVIGDVPIVTDGIISMMDEHESHRDTSYKKIRYIHSLEEFMSEVLYPHISYRHDRSKMIRPSITIGINGQSIPSGDDYSKARWLYAVTRYIYSYVFLHLPPYLWLDKNINIHRDYKNDIDIICSR